jgi:hypothetical protein
MSAIRKDSTAGHARANDNAADGAHLFVRSLVESIVLLLLLRVIESLFFGTGFFASLTLHPFWLVVLLSSMQHGLYSGVATAGLAALLLDWSPHATGVDVTDHQLAIAILPFQWLVASLCIGLFRHAQIRAQRQLAQDNARLQVINEALAAEVLRLDSVIRDLELEAATGTLATVQTSIASTEWSDAHG